MKTKKELLKEKIDKEYKFYEDMARNGISDLIAIKLEERIKRLMDIYNSME